jgi:hypothetical protein
MVGTSNGFVLEVSSEDANRTKECLLDGSSATCWESHSSLKPHWIRISSTTYSMMMNVKRLAISVSRMDRNYCPDNVTVHAGLKNASLHKVCELDIGQQVASTNEVVQVELCPVELEWEVIEIRIHTTLNGGRDCKVRGLEVELEEDVPSSFRTNMARLFEEGEGADVVFAVEGRQVRAHRYILAAQCPVLRSMLVGPFIEANVPREEEIVVHDIEEPVFRNVCGSSTLTTCRPKRTRCLIRCWSRRTSTRSIGCAGSASEASFAGSARRTAATPCSSAAPSAHRA